MLLIGCHLSSSKGYLAMGKQAKALNANTFQFFTRNPRGGSVKPFDKADADALNGFMEENRFAPLLAQAGRLAALSESNNCPMRICIVSTLAGGTGAGIFIQVALLLREYIIVG